MWTGDDLNKSPGALALLNAAPEGFRVTGELLRFFDGEQWDKDQRERRAGRPTLTVNMLPRLYALAVEAQAAIDRSGSNRLLPEDRLKCWIAHRNRDAQMLYNYLVSAAAERAAAQNPDARLVSPVQAGDAAWAAHRRYSQLNQTTDAPLDRDPAMWNSIAMAVIDYYLKQPKVPQ